MKVGDKVICIKLGYWEVVGSGEKCEGPEDKEELVIDQIHSNGDLIFFKWGMYNSWMSKWFRKLATHPNFESEISKELANKPRVKEGLEKVKEKKLQEELN